MSPAARRFGRLGQAYLWPASFICLALFCFMALRRNLLTLDLDTARSLAALNGAGIRSTSPAGAAALLQALRALLHTDWTVLSLSVGTITAAVLAVFLVAFIDKQSFPGAILAALLVLVALPGLSISVVSVRGFASLYLLAFLLLAALGQRLGGIRGLLAVIAGGALLFLATAIPGGLRAASIGEFAGRILWFAAQSWSPYVAVSLLFIAIGVAIARALFRSIRAPGSEYVPPTIHLARPPGPLFLLGAAGFVVLSALTGLQPALTDFPFVLMEILPGWWLVLLVLPASYPNVSAVLRYAAPLFLVPALLSSTFQPSGGRIFQRDLADWVRAHAAMTELPYEAQPPVAEWGFCSPDRYYDLRFAETRSAFIVVETPWFERMLRPAPGVSVTAFYRDRDLDPSVAGPAFLRYENGLIYIVVQSESGPFDGIELAVEKPNGAQKEESNFALCNATNAVLYPGPP